MNGTRCPVSQIILVRNISIEVGYTYFMLLLLPREIVDISILFKVQRPLLVCDSV